jgi:flagellar motor protein MotB
MGLLDPAIRRANRLTLDLAGSLILQVHRRGKQKPRRTPDHLLIEDASGFPGPALVEPVADFEALLMPFEVDGLQAKELARAAGKAALDGAVERLLETARRLPRNVRSIPEEIGAARGRQDPEREPDDSAVTGQSAECAAWDRFLAAYKRVANQRTAYKQSPDDLAAEQLRSAEIELEDAVAVAGEFEVHKIRWILA